MRVQKTEQMSGAGLAGPGERSIESGCRGFGAQIIDS